MIGQTGQTSDSAISVLVPRCIEDQEAHHFCVVPIYILDWIFCFFRTSSNCLFASASILRHISRLSRDSCLHASAIACAGDLGCRRVGFFLEFCGTGGFEAI